MPNIVRQWRTTNSQPTTSRDLPIRQVYAWLLTSDNHIVIVSKDGENWQLPGGKPADEEDAQQALSREVFEETGLCIGVGIVNFFGEYIIENSSTSPCLRYRQVRSWVDLGVGSSSLSMTVKQESTAQDPDDVIRHVKTIPVNEIGGAIPWILESDEYKSLIRTKVI